MTNLISPSEYLGSLFLVFSGILFVFAFDYLLLGSKIRPLMVNSFLWIVGLLNTYKSREEIVKSLWIAAFLSVIHTLLCMILYVLYWVASKFISFEGPYTGYTYWLLVLTCLALCIKLSNITPNDDNRFKFTVGYLIIPGILGALTMGSWENLPFVITFLCLFNIYACVSSSE